MNADTEIPEPDSVETAPHPRHTRQLFGQEDAASAFLDAYNSRRLHHGWLLTGPRGVGKATLAWHIARFLLAQPAPGTDAGGLFGEETPAAATSLAIDPEHPVARRVAALSEPRLSLIRRGWDEKGRRLRAVITVSEVRALRKFFGMSATEGGWRVVIVDAADEMNPNAANALLKVLEEPPPSCILLLVSHQPSALLPTIRSRCRVLRCATLGPEPMAQALAGAGFESEPGTAGAAALAELAGGSVGEAVRLASLDGLELYARLIGMLGALPRLDRQQVLAFADAAAGRGAEAAARFDLILRLIDLFLARLARRGASGIAGREAAPGEAALTARLAPDAASARKWAALQQELGARARHGRAVNLDPSVLVLDMVLKIEASARLAPLSPPAPAPAT